MPYDPGTGSVHEQPRQRARRDLAHKALIRAVRQYVRMAVPGSACIAIPNDHAPKGERDLRDRARDGVTSGAFDLSAILPFGKVLWIECKTGKARLSDKQDEFAETLTGLGHTWVVARSIEDVEEALRSMGFGVSATARIMASQGGRWARVAR